MAPPNDRYSTPAGRRSAYEAANAPLRTAAVAPGVLLGLGFGAFADGILLHQILQWHNMLSAKVPPTGVAAMRLNMAWDGYFHAGALALTVAGAWALWAAGRRGAVPSARRFFGQIVLGWGLFNLVEGVIDHQLLRLHHVMDLPAYVPAADWVFLGVGGVALAVVGWALARGREAIR